MKKFIQRLLRFFSYSTYQVDREVPYIPPPSEEEKQYARNSLFVLDRRTHKLSGIRYVHDPDLGFDMQPKGIVIHFTCSYTLEDTIDYFKQNEVDIHLLVGKSGEVVQMVPFNKTAAHAGKSSWRGFSALNNHFIGIEVICLGQLKKSGEEFFDYYGRKYSGKVHEGDMLGYRYWEPFTEKQLETLVSVCALLCREYSIPTTLICGHHECSPGRKVDPGGSLTMPMETFRALVSKKISEK